MVNVNLNKRPEWYNDVLHAGTVPVLYQDEKVISGSMPIAEYLEEAYPQPRLLPSDPYLKALDRSFLDVALPVSEHKLSVASVHDDARCMGSTAAESFSKAWRYRLALRKALSQAATLVSPFRTTVKLMAITFKLM